MGNRKNAKKSKQASSGQRKTQKAEAVAAADTTPPPRPKPIPKVRLTVSWPTEDKPQTSAVLSNKEEEAVAALVSMGRKDQVPRGGRDFEAEMDRVFCSTVPGMDGIDLTEGAEGDEPSKNSDSESSDSGESNDSDNDSDTVLEIPVSSPAQEAREKKASKFAIPFEVPLNGPVRYLDGITSQTTFDVFLDELAHAMCTRKSLLSGIAYIPSYKPKTPKPMPKLLDNEQAWKRLITDVQNHIDSSKSKQGGKGAVKPFFIQIVDTSGGDSKASAGGSGAKKVMITGYILFVPTYMIYRVKKARIPSPLSRKHQNINSTGNLSRNICVQSTTKHVFVQSDGNHYHLTASDLAKWAHMMHMHIATLNTIPDELNITDVGPRQQKAKKALQRTAPSDEPLQWMQSMMGIMGGLIMPRNPTLYETPPRAAPLRAIPGSSSARGSDHPPSSGTKRTADMHAPDIQQWLSSLDSDPVRGRHNSYFVQYTQSLENSGILDLTDIEDLSAAEIAQFSTAPIGTVNRIVKYAKEDLAKLLNEARKRARN
ncbi:hypothetical protein B0H17DRAFT_1211161 [Mycena rosella]|uniref:Uncharacterized protein n=1 Tax=Mycena rosella TaxID=1033263 RepID=A0AAD7CUV2_MYCRO|nr:hypothetical protein B0H17DRAFT_1211161 [Mycena rosella]